MENETMLRSSDEWKIKFTFTKLYVAMTSCLFIASMLLDNCSKLYSLLNSSLVCCISSVIIFISFIYLIFFFTYLLEVNLLSLFVWVVFVYYSCYLVFHFLFSLSLFLNYLFYWMILKDLLYLL